MYIYTINLLTTKFFRDKSLTSDYQVYLWQNWLLVQRSEHSANNRYSLSTVEPQVGPGLESEVEPEVESKVESEGEPEFKPEVKPVVES